MTTDAPTKKCPFCAETILAEAIKCRFCQSMLTGPSDIRHRGLDGPLPASCGSGPPDMRHRGLGGPLPASCGSDSVGAPAGSPPSTPTHPSLLALLLWNLVCPGLGSYKLVHRWRGGIILGILSVALILWTMDAVVIVQKVVQEAVKTGKPNLALKMSEQLHENVWASVSWWVFVYSFVDLLILFPWKKEPDKPTTD